MHEDGFDILRLYPDLHAAGSLDKLLDAALSKIESRVRCSPPADVTFYARVEHDHRFCQMYVAKHERLFLFDFWRDGVDLATGNSPQIDLAATAIRRWVADEVSLDELDAFAFVTLHEDALAFDRGIEVEMKWASYLESIPTDSPELSAFVTAAANEPKLRQLFPYRSMWWFCFSRCTGYPFTSDTPYVRSGPDGSYHVFDPDASEIGAGDAAEAVRIVVENLPENCGPAVRGTAETMNE